MTRILLYDDNEGYRQNLATLLSSDPDLTVIGQFSDCRFLREQVEAHRPDLVFLDVDMPHVNGLQGLFLLKKHFPEVRAVMLTIFDENDSIFEAICLGADGYLLKHTSPARLLQSVHDLLEGGSAMTPAVARKVLQLFQKSGMRHGGHYDLTDREKEVLGHLVNGLSYKMVAAEMFVSINTIRTHVTSVYQKLQVHSVSEAVAKAIREQIV